VDLARVNANLLVALDLLLEEQSVGRAADRHRVTPSAMSHSLRALRDLFGDPLLIKTRRGMRATPLALALRGPLRRSLRDLGRAISTGLEFDPAHVERSFVIAAPDFISTLLMPHVARLLAGQAPRVAVEIRPIQRRGSALLLRDTAALADGEIDLLVGAILDVVPELSTERLYEERFVCIVREGHPLARGKRLDLARYASAAHLVVTITDERSATWIDTKLAEQGLARRIAIRTRYFTTAPLVVADSDLIATVPRQLAMYFRRRAPLVILEPPFQLEYEEHVAWHQRYDADPAVQWLRSVLVEAARAATSPPSAPRLTPSRRRKP
jgi:DNA-binding transcriptional LysR family regulator